MSKSTFKVLLLFVAIFILSSDLMAQCAMCKAVATSSIDGGSEIGKGLNNGILYLMSVPYLILGGIAYALYRNKKIKQKQSNQATT